MNSMRCRIAAFLAMVAAFSGASAQSLSDYYSKVLGADPRLAIADATTEVVAAQRRQALGDLLPRITAQAGLNRTHREGLSGPLAQPGTFDTSRYALSLEQPLFNVPRLKSYRESEVLLRQAEFDSLDRRIRIRLDVVDRYLSALSSAEKLTLARREEQIASTQLEQVRALQARQLAKVTDLLTLAARVDLLRAARVRAEGELQTAKDSLSELTAEPFRELFSLGPDTALPPYDEGVERWEARGAESNPAVKAQSEAVARADIEIERRQWLRAPVLSLQASAQESDIGYDNSLYPNTRTSVLSLNVTVPLYAGGSVNAMIGEARARRRIADRSLEATRRGVVSGVRSAHGLLRSLAVQAEAASRAIESTGKSREAAERAFALGVITISELLDARRESFAAQRDAMNVRLEYLRQWTTLHQFAGSLDDAAIRRLSGMLGVPVAP